MRIDGRPFFMPSPQAGRRGLGQASAALHDGRRNVQWPSSRDCMFIHSRVLFHGAACMVRWVCRGCLAIANWLFHGFRSIKSGRAGCHP